MSTKIKTLTGWKTVSTVGVCDKRNPDWANAVSVTGAQLTAGYTCPTDGIFCGRIRPTKDESIGVSASGVSRVLVMSASADQYAGFQFPVEKGNLVNTWDDGANNAYTMAHFVPYKVS